MDPTPPNGWYARWWSNPDLHYSANSRLPYPTHPAAAASSAAPHTGATAGAAAAEGAAAHHLANSAGGGMGGHPPPPRGPGGYYHHYPRRGYYGYPGGRPYFRRFLWLGIGFVGASWWFHHREHKREEFERYISDPKCWSNMHQYRQLPTVPSAPPTGVPPAAEPAVAAAPPAALVNNVQSSAPAVWDKERKPWGWKGRKERRLREEAETRAQAQALEAAAAATTAATTAAASSAGITAPSEMEKLKQTKEFKKLKEAVENLWANENAREYAREKLDQLSVSLDRLRESLKEDPKNPADRKLV